MSGVSLCPIRAIPEGGWDNRGDNKTVGPGTATNGVLRGLTLGWEG